MYLGDYTIGVSDQLSSKKKKKKSIWLLKRDWKKLIDDDIMISYVWCTYGSYSDKVGKNFRKGS